MNFQKPNDLRIYILPSLIGVGFGVGTARTLFELNPLTFEYLGDPLPTFVLALLGAALLFGMHLLGRKSHGRSSEATSFHPDLIHLPLLLPLLTAFSSNANPIRCLVLLGCGLLGWLALQLVTVVNQHRWSSFWARLGPPLGLFVVLLALYIRTLAPTIGAADTFEFQVNVIRLAVSHGSGYPLYILLAKLFSWLPVGGSEAYRINLSSAVFGALAVVAAYLVGRRLQASVAASLLAALSLGVSFSVWSRAVEAEVYTLNLLFVGIILWLLLSASRSPLGARYTPLIFLALGLSCANHLTTILLIPPVLLGLFITKVRIPRRTWAVSFALFLLGLAVYLYLPIRWPAVNDGEAMTIERFLYFFTAKNARVALRPLAFVQDLGRYGIVGRKVLDQYGWVGIGLGMLGLASLTRRHWPRAAVTALVYAAYVYFGLSHYSPDPDFSSFLLPAHLVQTVWIAVGIDGLIRFSIKISKWKLAGLDHAWPPILYTICALLPISSIWQNYHRVDQSGDWDAYNLGRTIMDQPLSLGAAILADSEKMPPLYYLQVAENLRPDLDIVVLYDEPGYRADLEARIANGQKVYLGRYLPHLASKYSLESVGPLVEVNPKLRAGNSSKVKAQFGKEVQLVDFDMESNIVVAGEMLSITLAWQAIGVPHDNHLVNFRLQDETGEIAQAWPGRVPVAQMYPMNAWPLGRIVEDYHSMLLEHSLTPGEYRLQVGLFPPFSDSGLPVSDTGTPWATITPMTILPAASSAEIGQPTRMRMGEGLWLLGYNLPTSVAPGAALDLILHWMTFEQLAQPLFGEVTESGATLATLTIPVHAYPPRHPFSTRVRLIAPQRDGNLHLQIGRRGELSRCRWLERPTPHCTLDVVSLEDMMDGVVVNFDNMIVLEGLDILTPEARPGEMVKVISRWRSLGPMTEDYTIFVHLLGPDGRLHGQVDIWPAQGTLPTSKWQPGQVVRDLFEIGLQADAPAGEYQIEIGWYLLTTLERLPVLRSDGTPIADMYLQSGLVVR